MNFIIAIGGTGMRCLESFVYLCTIGMCDGMEFNVLMLDTDIQNGNMARVNNLIDDYNIIKGQNPTPKKKTFFSAKINKHIFKPVYDVSRQNFKSLAKLSNPTNQDLADLFFDQDTQSFDLEHGYRAQTQLGSYLMYHSILEPIIEKYKPKNPQDEQEKDDRKNKKKNDAVEGIVSFIRAIYLAGKNAKIFIMGSVFGGTGASSIPILPRVIKEAITIIEEGGGDKGGKPLIGCLLMTNYFTFRNASGSEKGDQKIIADAGKFAINSQAALMFYEDDKTVLNAYNIMYHIGYPYSNIIDLDKGRPEEASVHTGGVDQTNPAHLLELLAASAAYDFFKHYSQESQESSRKIVYKRIEEENDEFAFSPASFFSEEDSVFRKKLASFYLLNFFLKDVEWDLNNFLKIIRKDNSFVRYSNLENRNQIQSLNNIIKSFGFSITGSIKPGWLWQLKHLTVNALFFNPECYVNDRDKISEFDYGKLLENIDKVFTNKWFRCPYDRIRRRFLKSSPLKEQNAVSPIECLLAQFYNTFDKLI